MDTLHPVPLAGVFGGGGLFGIGYALGVLDGLRMRGIELRGCPMLGTSAGSWAAAAVALGIPFDRFAHLHIPRFPDPRRGVLAEVARRIFGDATHHDVRVVVCRLPRLQRTVLAGADLPLADLVAASSAVPGLLAPHVIDGAQYVDGGVRSAVSADLSTIAHRLVVIAPLAGAMFGPFGGLVTRRTDQELDEWRSRGGGQTMVFSPRTQAAALARWPGRLFRADVAHQAYEIGRTQGSTADVPWTL